MGGKRRLLILGLARYDLAQRELHRLGETPVEVEVYIRNSPNVYPSPARFRKLLAKSPEERRAAVRQWRIRHHEKLCQALARRKFTVLYYNGDPVGIRVWLPAKDLRRIFTPDEIERIEVLRIKGRTRKRKMTSKTPNWFAVKARFAEQIEGETGGMQTYEDRTVIVLARSFADAGRKAMKEIREYETPMLDVTGHFFRWGFEAILDIYDMTDDKIDPAGTEVYSEMKTRRMKPAYEWHPSRKTS